MSSTKTPKIINPGIIPPPIHPNSSGWKELTCSRCRCVFRNHYTNYKVEHGYYCNSYVDCPMPECGNRVIMEPDLMCLDCKSKAK